MLPESSEAEQEELKSEPIKGVLVSVFSLGIIDSTREFHCENSLSI
jgi:hypothetical protein